ncbi:glycosyltransferase family 2 protein [Streptomyces sp. NBC_00356]|uniref:glycosyltransferase family 2 protein n=1 Tax=Streptomyces sp. NBC_00356 TaxID=2975724 RepID=UPI002E25BA62
MNPTSAPPVSLPDATVALRVQNQDARLSACLDSLFTQTLGTDRMQIVAVDDGSSDSSGSLLRELSADRPELLTVELPRRGTTPAEARNAAIEHTRGRYVIFLDASDQLAPDALERMVRAADRNEADVVLGKPAALGKRSVPTSMFRKSSTYAAPLTSRVYWTLTPDKLFRTELLRRAGLSFPTDLRFGEDQPFTAAAYLAADAVSVVADGPCVLKGSPAPPSAPVGPSDRCVLAERMMSMVHSLVPEGPGRDRLLSRHLEVELGKATGAALLGSDSPEERRQTLTHAESLLNSLATPGSLALLPRPLAVRYALLAGGHHEHAVRMAEYSAAADRPTPKKVVDGGRVFAALPYFRDPAVELPDSVFDITDQMKVMMELQTLRWSGSILHLEGFAFFDQLSTASRRTRVLLRHRDTGTEERYSVTAHRDDKLVNSKGRPRAMGRFAARVNLAQSSDGWPLAPGIWDVLLSVSFEGVTRQVPLGAQRAASVDVVSRLPQVLGHSPRTEDHQLVAVPAYTEQGHLILEISERLPLPQLD